MATLLTSEQLQQLREIIQTHHAALIAKLVGPEVLSDLEAQLIATGQAPELLDSIRDSFFLGQAIGAGAASQRTDYAALRAWVDQQGAKLGPVEQQAAQAAQVHAGAHLRHLGARLVQQLEDLYFSEDSRARARLTQEVRDETAENIARREGLGALRKRLRDAVDHNTRDWDRVALTEKAEAMSQGLATQLQQDHGDPWVFKILEPGACGHCKRLQLGADGHPKLFRLSALQASGTNAGRKAADWQPVVGPIHPNCMCTLSRMPEGWGFDEDGDMVPGGRFGLRDGEAPKPKLKKAEAPQRLRPPSGGARLVVPRDAVVPRTVDRRFIPRARPEDYARCEAVRPQVGRELGLQDEVKNRDPELIRKRRAQLEGKAKAQTQAAKPNRANRANRADRADRADQTSQASQGKRAPRKKKPRRKDAAAEREDEDEAGSLLPGLPVPRAPTKRKAAPQGRGSVVRSRRRGPLLLVPSAACLAASGFGRCRGQPDASGSQNPRPLTASLAPRILPASATARPVPSLSGRSEHAPTKAARRLWRGTCGIFHSG